MNNRQIKFRVWCKVQNKFEYDWQKVISSGYNYKDEKYPNGIDVTNDELLVFQQFTGLLDKNENEIYEGDVLKCRGLGTYETVTVKDIRRIPIQVSAWPTAYGKGNGDCEVIGNVFENLELIPHD
jgi:hypothetical protein